eukprot:11392-Heterococcus_DN1.PRE.2
MFQSKDFEVDTMTEEWKRQHPSAQQQSSSGSSGKKKRGRDAGSESDDLGDDANDDADAVLADRFTRVGGNSDGSDVDSDDDFESSEDEQPVQRKQQQQQKSSSSSSSNSKGKSSSSSSSSKPKFYELNEGEDTSAVLGLAGQKDRAQVKERADRRSVPLAQRLKSVNADEARVGKDTVRKTAGGLVREFTFTPKDSRGSSSNSRGDSRGDSGGRSSGGRGGGRGGRSSGGRGRGRGSSGGKRQRL